MNRFRLFPAVLCCGALVIISGCSKDGKADTTAEGPPPATVVEEQDVNVLQVNRPERFTLAKAVEAHERPTLDVNGTVAPDVSRTVPVVSLASGRVVDIRARLGDTVQKGQLLLRIQSNDLAAAFSDYQNAVADEQLARTQLERAKTLYERGAVARKDLDVAEDAAVKAQVVVRTTAARLHVLGANPDTPTTIIDIMAPQSGVIIEQNVTAASAVKSVDNSPNLFTIADLSHVWILCDVYENDLSAVRVGEIADVRLNAYPDQVFHARISNIGPVLDSSTRTAKVRLDITNPGIMKAGMFVTATFFGRSAERVAIVPAGAVLHLHDRDWVYTPAGPGKFRRREIAAGALDKDGMQIVKRGVKPGDEVVANALQLTAEAQQ
jgi:cobalt-zinc-cadmium efflux system membrane fusion protein